MPEFANRPPSAPSIATLRNRREAAVVDWLIERIATRLADRNGERHPPPWEPRQNVLLGVLEPIKVRVPSPGADTDTSGSSETVTKTSGEVPSIGLDFRIKATGMDTIDLLVDVNFALYLEEVAAFDEQRTYLGSGPAPVRSLSNDDPSSAADPGETAGAEKSEAAGVSHEMLPEGERSRTPKRSRAKRIRLFGAWRRHDVAIGPVRISVPLDGSVTNIADPIQAAVRSLLEIHYRRHDAMRPFASGRNEIAQEALDDESSFRSAISSAFDRNWMPVVPDLQISVFAQPLGGDEHLVSVTFRNHTRLTERPLQDLSVYDCRLSVQPAAPARIVPQRFDLAPDDYRLLEDAEVVGRGTACVAVPTGSGGIRTETLPIHVQAVVVPRADHVEPPRWSELAVDPTSILESVHKAMAAFEIEFAGFVNNAAGQPYHAEAGRELAQFSDELRRFRLGCRAMQIDERLAQAFRLATCP